MLNSTLTKSQAAGFTVVGSAIVILFQIVHSMVMAPIPEPLPAVEKWYVVSNGEVIDSPKVVAVADSLPQGSFQLKGFPKVGLVRELNITITGKDWPAPEPPNPDPPKPPTPTPPLPPSPLTGLARETFEQVKSLPKDQSKKLASNYESVASAIAARGILTLADAEKKLFELNRGLALGREWSGFALWSGGKLDALKELNAVGLALDEIANGLRAAGESQ